MLIGKCRPIIFHKIDFEKLKRWKDSVMEKISIIMIVYDVEKYLRQSIESVLNQTYKNIELILSVSPGKDKCEEICEEYASRDDRVIVVKSEPKGPPAARNAGLSKFTGDYLGFVDADDYVDSDMFETMISNMHKCEADIAVCGRYYEYENTTLKDPNGKPVVMTGDEAVEVTLSGTGFFLHTWDKLFKRDIVKDLYFPEDIAVEDRIIVDKLLGSAKYVVYDSTPKYHFRERYGSLSKQRGITRKNCESNDMLMDYVLTNHPSCRNQCYRFMLYEYITAIQNILTSDDFSKDDYREYCDRIHQICTDAKGNPLISSKIKLKAQMALHAPGLLKAITKSRKKKTADTYIRFE